MQVEASFTANMLYGLAQMGFQIDILRFSPGLVTEVMEAGAAHSAAACGKYVKYEQVDTSVPLSMEF